MMSIRNKYILVFLSLVFVVSCGNNKEETNSMDSSLGRTLLCNRTSSVIDLFSYSKDEYGRYSPSDGSEVNTGSFILYIGVGCDIEQVDRRRREDLYKKKYRIPGDPIMEEQIKRWMEMRFNGKDQIIIWGTWNDSADSGMGHLANVIEYRTDKCQSLRITSSFSLFNRGNNCDITDKLVFDSIEDPGNEVFIFTWDKELIGPVLEGMTISEYLSYEPMVLPYSLLKFSELPPELPVETDLTVEMTLSNGKTLSDTVHVKLTK